MVMELSQADLDYFARGERSNPRFWSRFGGAPDFRAKRALDVGCGHGSLCLDMAAAGAQTVVGLDLNTRLIDFAQTYLEQYRPELRERVAFHCLDLAQSPLDGFDLIVSKDTFEHILDLQGMLAEIARRLAPGGRLYAGFGPLYHSPFGDHDAVRLGPRLPWAHVLMGDRRLIAHVNRRRRTPIASVQELGLNQLRLADYRRLLAQSGLRLISLQTNRSEKPGGRLLAGLARLPWIADYMTFNIYCILEKPGAGG